MIATKEGEAFFSSLGMQYAYGLTVLHPETAKHWNFQILGGESTGTYAFNTGFYGLTIMPPEFEKIMDNVLHKTKNTFTYSTSSLYLRRGQKTNI